MATITPDVSIPLDEDTWCLLVAVATGYIDEDDAAAWMQVGGPTVDAWIHEAEMRAAALCEEGEAT